ncbi:hypothetical protein M9Y10_044181 [Tritrichomonas musculus]|uniref:Uncharacterized protein n=1 Tax=Tritrichomonas musculus TaxID=1915356 RepID=A0ABR2K1S4_9EUKA
MTIYFWSDFALCAKLEDFIPFFYADNLKELQRWMTIQRCTTSIDHVDSPIYIDSLVALLIFMFDKSMNYKIAKFLLTVINMESIGETCSIEE